MTRRIFALSLAAGATTLRASDNLARGREVIDKAIGALGGDAFRSLRTRTETGRSASFYHDRLSSLSIARFYTKYLPVDGPETVHEAQRQVYGKKQTDSVLYTSSGAYELTFRGARVLPEDQANDFREATLREIFYILHQRIGEPGMQFESHGVDVVENQPVETIEIYDSENRNVTVWLNANTYLPVKTRYYQWDPTIKERREYVTSYTKYRTTGGVMWPHETGRERDSDKIFQLFADKVTINDAPATDAQGNSLFELPAGITILKQ
jgi:hypothetical protein